MLRKQQSVCVTTMPDQSGRVRLLVGRSKWKCKVTGRATAPPTSAPVPDGGNMTCPLPQLVMVHLVPVHYQQGIPVDRAAGQKPATRTVPPTQRMWHVLARQVT